MPQGARLTTEKIESAGMIHRGRAGRIVSTPLVRREVLRDDIKLQPSRLGVLREKERSPFNIASAAQLAAMAHYRG